MGSGLNGQVTTLAVDPNGNILAGGLFDGGLARWNGSSWEVLGCGVTGHVRSIALGTFGQIYVGGHITQAGGAAASMVAAYSGNQ